MRVKGLFAIPPLGQCWSTLRPDFVVRKLW